MRFLGILDLFVAKNRVGMSLASFESVVFDGLAEKGLFLCWFFCRAGIFQVFRALRDGKSESAQLKTKAPEISLRRSVHLRTGINSGPENLLFLQDRESARSTAHEV